MYVIVFVYVGSRLAQHLADHNHSKAYKTCILDRSTEFILINLKNLARFGQKSIFDHKFYCY